MAFWYSWQEGKVYSDYKAYTRSLINKSKSNLKTNDPVVVSRTYYNPTRGNLIVLYRKPKPDDSQRFRGITVQYQYDNITITREYFSSSSPSPPPLKSRQAYTGQLPSRYVKVASNPQRTANGIITRQLGSRTGKLTKKITKQKPKKSSLSSKKIVKPKLACSAGLTWCDEATKRAILAQKQAEKASKQTKPTKPKSPTTPTDQIDLATATVKFAYFRLPDPPAQSADPVLRKLYRLLYENNPVHNQIKNAQREAEYYANNPQLNTIMYVFIGSGRLSNPPTDPDFNRYQAFVNHMRVQIQNAIAVRPYQIFENGRWRWKTQAERRASV